MKPVKKGLLLVAALVVALPLAGCAAEVGPTEPDTTLSVPGAPGAGNGASADGDKNGNGRGTISPSVTRPWDPEPGPNPWHEHGNGGEPVPNPWAGGLGSGTNQSPNSHRGPFNAKTSVPPLP